MQTLTMATLLQLQTSIEREAWLRETARQVELDPSRASDAKRLFRLASTVRQGRMELLERCGIA